MIKDRLGNAGSYFWLSENLKKGFVWLQNTELTNLPDGRYEIDEGNIYANVQSYETKDDALYEAHREYADIQYMIKGREKAGVADYSECNNAKPYEKERDIEFLNHPGDECFQTLAEGEFLVFFPQDAHKPSIKYNEKSLVKKVVVKVRI